MQMQTSYIVEKITFIQTSCLLKKKAIMQTPNFDKKMTGYANVIVRQLLVNPPQGINDRHQGI